MIDTPNDVLVAGDWHGDPYWACRVAHALPALLPDERNPVILHLGDFGIWPGRAGAEYLADLDRALRHSGGRLYFVQGNHDDHDRLDALNPQGRPIALTSRISWLPTGTRWEWHGHSWVAAGGAASVDRALRTPGKDWWPGEALTKKEARSIIAAGPADVMVCHEAPAKVPLNLGTPDPSWAVADLARSQAQRDLLQRVVDAVRPTRILHGHHHLERHGEVVMDHGPVMVHSLDAQRCSGNLMLLDVRRGVRTPVGMAEL